MWLAKMWHMTKSYTTSEWNQLSTLGLYATKYFLFYCVKFLPLTYVYLPICVLKLNIVQLVAWNSKLKYLIQTEAVDLFRHETPML